MEHEVYETGFENAEREYQRNIVDCINSLVEDLLVISLQKTSKLPENTENGRSLALKGVYNHNHKTEKIELRKDWYLRIFEEPDDEVGYRFREISLYKTDEGDMTENLLSSVAFDYNPQRDDFMLYEESTSSDEMIDWLDLLRTSDAQLKLMINKHKEGKDISASVSVRHEGES